MADSKRDHLPGVLRGARVVMLVLVTLAVIAATTAAIAESYNGLYNWALEHRFSPGWEANIAPLMVDTFIIVGEAMLFVLIVDRRRVGWIWIPVIFSGAGLVLSFTGNVSRLRNADLATRVGHGLAPVAAAAGLLGAMVLLHLIAGDYDALVPAAPARGKSPRKWRIRMPRFHRPLWTYRVPQEVTEPAAVAPSPAPEQRQPQPPPAPLPAAAPRRSKVPASAVKNNVPPTEAELEKVRVHLRQIAPGDKWPTDRDLAALFFAGRQRRAMGRVLDEDEFQTRPQGIKLVPFPVAQPDGPALVDGQVSNG